MGHSQLYHSLPPGESSAGIPALASSDLGYFSILYACAPDFDLFRVQGAVWAGQGLSSSPSLYEVILVAAVPCLGQG